MEAVIKGEIIAREFNKMVWVKDKNGAEYACYVDNPNSITRKEDLTAEEQNKCTNLNLVLGDSW